jgi:hypothetical protein
VAQTVSQGLDLLTAQTGLSFSQDIQPWLGSQMALAFEPPSGPEPGFALLVASKDDGRAQAALSKLEGGPQFGGGLTWKSEPYQGVDVRVGEAAPTPQRAYAVVDNTVVISNEADVVHEVIDTMQGRAPNLADDPAYTDTVDGLPKSVLGLAYVNLRGTAALLQTGGLGGGVSVGSSYASSAPSPTPVSAASTNQ